MSFLERLKLPEAKQITNLDAPEATQIHRRIIQEKFLLKQLYIDFYNQFRWAIEQDPSGIFLEIGSGSGIIKEIFPNVITSDILTLSYLDLCCSALQLPFPNNSLSAILMINTLHHIPDAGKFFREIQRCLKPGGKLIMIEPANTFCSRIIYQHFHHEPFAPQAREWHFATNGPLSSANGALPWIIFQRDRKKFIENFPGLSVISYRNHTPLRYLLSGGFTLRQLVPSCFNRMIKVVEWLLTPFNGFCGLFTTIAVQKINPS